MATPRSICHIRFVIITINLLISCIVYAQEYGVSKPPCDSIVTDDGEGHRSVKIVPLPLNPSVASPKPSKQANSISHLTLDDVINRQSAQVEAAIDNFRSQSHPTRDLSSYSIGRIPFEESVSPTGARLYSIPIITASGWKLTPAISLVYNSQSGNNVAGYGWGLSGLSSISVRNENLYYDGQAKAGIYDSWTSDYALDGIPLVTSEMGIDNYTLSTSRGKVQIQKHINATGRVLYFTALYPDGSSAVYGFTDSNIPHPTYPITSLTDIDGNSISFSYTEYGNHYYVSSIQYGANASIEFTYSSRNDGTPYQYASWGSNVSFPQRLLKTVRSKDGSTIICQYSLTHQMLDGVSLLKELHCTSGSSELPPLLFEYGIDSESGNQSPAFTETKHYLFETFYTHTQDTVLLYKRGRLIPGSTNDAIITLPSFSTYTKIGSQWVLVPLQHCFEWGSAYSPDQPILCNFTGPYNTSFQQVLTAGHGFQLIEAVDIDGDGVDELVKVNNWSPQPEVTNYKITIYSFDSTGSYTSSCFIVSIDDGTQNILFNNPAKSYYRFGNFRGDGKPLLLIMTRDASKFALVDLNEQVKLSETTLFTNGDEEDNLVIVADFENDGKDDLCHVTTSGMDVYSLSSGASTSFSFRTTYSGISKSLLYTDPDTVQNGVPQEVKSRIFVVDINGDGYRDVASAPGLNFDIPGLTVNSGTWNFAYFNGKRFNTVYRSLSTRNRDDMAAFLDVNKDGLPDLLQLHCDTLSYSPNINGIVYSTSNYTPLILDASSDLIPGDCSLFGTSGSLLISSGPSISLYEFSLNHTERRNLCTLTDSFGVLYTNLYESIEGNSFSYYIDGTRSYSASNGFYRSRIPLYVLYGSQKYISANQPTFSSISYSYWDQVCHSQGLGFCGFGKILTVDYTNGVYRFTTLNPEKFGVPECVTMSKSYNGTAYSTVVNTYDNNTTTYGKLNPRLTTSVSTSALTGIVTTTTYTYGSHDLPTSILTSRRIGTGTAKTENVKRTYEHSIASDKYVLGIVTEESVIMDGDGVTTFKWKVKSVNTYDSNYHLLSTQKYVGKFGKRRIGNTIIESYDATNLESETQWQYDSYGNIILEKVAPYGATEFTGNTYSYDNYGRYLTSKTDALGHTTSIIGYNKFGKPAVLTDFNNRSTSYSYDNWGNVVSVSHPDGTVEQTAVAWGGSGLYTVTNTATGTPMTISHYDALGRDIHSGIKRFNGQWQWVDKEYDDRGLLYRKSLPYRGANASYWDTYSYDDYNRPDTLIAASGNISAWSYSGTSVTTVKDGITSTSTTDANGDVVSVTDAGGTITYTIRDDRQTSKIIAPGNVITTFTYDDYGRRTMIVDPSAGTQSDSYLWNSDGASEFTHTGPNGTVKTYRDKYGRTTLIERPGEYNTAYTYDTDGRIHTKQSTNGTSIEYYYDSYDRIISVKETAPNVKWLKKVYIWGTGNVLNSIQYISQSGPITKETYTYSNGHNTGITLSDGTVVWSLTSENDFGMPTAMTTGTISREYGYTAFGLPTYRRMDNGDLQDFTYQFDVSTGNLLSRSDLVNGQTEAFGYDNLNRLVAIGSRQISYAANGNILSMDGVGTMTYGTSSRPYQITMLEPEEDGLVPNRQQSVSYTCYNRPSILTEGGRSAAFTYNGDGDRVKMYVADSTSNVLTRYYLGGRYEYDLTPNGTKQRLYLGGDAYSAPMVYQKVDNGSWTAYNIGRDYLGNITHIATTSGTLVAEYSYDPWGRLRDPETLDIYPAGYEPELFLGRGFTGHEHLTWFGLVNMNARLYDPLLGRFLSPDPYVQAPEFTQSFNRYTYALNNPLKYSDFSGELFGIDDALFVIAAGAVIGSLSGAAIAGQTGAQGFTEWAGYIIGGAAVGAVSAGWASAVGGAVASLTHLGGFIGGAISGIASGATGGAISGFFNTLMAGGSFYDATLSSLESAGIGALTGGIIGGISGGISSTRHGGNFWNGIGETFDYYDPSVYNGNLDPVDYSQETVQTFSEKNFGNNPEWIKLKADGSLPNGYSSDANGVVYNSEGNKVYGTCTRSGLREYTTFVFKSACSSKQQLYLTLGHEYYHAYLWRLGIPGDSHHPIISDWQYRQALEWNYRINMNTHYYLQFHTDPHMSFGDYYYLGLNNLIPILNRWHIL